MIHILKYKKNKNIDTHIRKIIDTYITIIRIIINNLLTNRLELLFRTVLAFPNASNNGLDSKMISLTLCEKENKFL